MSVLFRSLIIEGLRRNLSRSLVTLIAVALGIAASLAIDLANATALRSFSSAAEIVSDRVNLQVLGVGKGFDENAYLRIRSIPGITDAAPVVEGSIVIGARRGDPLSGEILRLTGIDTTHQSERSDNSDTRQTTDPPPDPYLLIAERGIILPEHTAARLHLHLGDRFTALAGAHPVRLRVAAIIHARDSLADSGVAFADIVTVQELFEKIGSLDRIDCVVDPAHLDAVQKQIATLLPPGARVITPRTRTDEIQRMLRSFQSNLAALSYISLLIGMYLIYNAIAVSVARRRREVSTLRALGVSRMQIFALFLGEGLLYGLGGSLLGIAFGTFLARFAVTAVLHTVSSIYVGTTAEGVVYAPFSLLKAMFAGLSLAALSAVVPALEAADAPPALAMRGTRSLVADTAFDPRPLGVLGAGLLALALLAARLPAIESTPVFGYASALLTIFGASLLIPLLVRATVDTLGGIAVRLSPAAHLGITHFGASVRRNSVAIASLMVAASMTVGIAILVVSFRTSVIGWANQTLRADLFIRPVGVKNASSVGLFPPAMLATLRAIPGVADADGFRAISVPYGGTLITVGASDLSLLGKREQLRLLGTPDLPHLAVTLARSNEALASEPFVTRFGTREGETVTIPTPSGPATLRIVATYNDYSGDSGTLILDTHTYARLFHDDTFDSLAVFAKPGVDLVDLRTRLFRALAPLRVDVRTNRELRDLVITIFNRTFAITNALYTISIVIAALGVTSTLFTLVLERRHEIALLRRLGFSLSNVRAMVLTEAGLVGLLSGITGVAVGIALGLLLVFVIDRQSFGWLIELHMPYAFLIGTVLASVALSILAGIYPAEEAARTRTAEALRTE